MYFRKMTKADAKDCLDLFFFQYGIERKTCNNLPVLSGSLLSEKTLLMAMNDILDVNSSTYPGYVCLDSGKLRSLR